MPTAAGTSADQRNIVILGYEGNTALDLIGAAETFFAASYLRSPPAYRVITASVDGSSFRSQVGVQITPECRLDEIDPIDTLIIPGGAGLRKPEVAEAIVDWIRRNHDRVRRVAAVCTGSFGLAATGLLDGRRATTHWRFAEQAKTAHPQVEWATDAIFVRDGKFFTSGGMTAGIDLALALIDEDLGPAAALSVARELVVYVKRSGGQHQFSDRLRFQSTSVPKIRELIDFVESRLEEDLGVERLAAQANLSVRHFTRLFRDSLAMPPAEFVERARLSEGLRRLAETEIPIERLAHSIGYRSDDAFSRAFRRRFGIAPSEYRERFSSPGNIRTPEPG